MIAPAVESHSPQVSVVICVIDADPVYFVEAVRSILDQTLTDLELIIIEEPSSRDGRELLAHIDDPRVRHHMHPERTSLVQQRNRGIELARAEFIAVLDADDIALPDRLRKQLDFMRAHPDVGALGGQLQLIDPSGATIGYRHYPTAPGDVTAALSRYNPIGQPAVMYRKAIVEKVGCYTYSKWPATEDYELWCRLASTGVRIANLPDLVLKYRIHPGGQKVTRMRGTLRGTIEIKEMYFTGRFSRLDRVRLLGERVLLRLPGPVVLGLFMLLSTRRDPPPGP